MAWVGRDVAHLVPLWYQTLLSRKLVFKRFWPLNICVPPEDADKPHQGMEICIFHLCQKWEERKSSRIKYLFHSKYLSPQDCGDFHH